METGQESVGKKIRAINDKVEKKRVHSARRCGTATVHLPDWRITNGQSRTTQLVVSFKEGKQVSKLREPRNLYALPNKHHHSNLNAPRWPMGMKVLTKHPKHQNYLPPDPEMFYNADLDNERTDSFPILTKAEDGELVYENTIGQSKYFDHAQVGGNAVKVKHNNSLQANDFNTLRFESRFESGNLLKAVKVGPFDYQLWLRTDLYTKKYIQWYYFRVENTRPEATYRFTIMNFMKSSSLYSNGMKPLMYSEREAKENGIGWRRVGMNIKYYKNELKRDDVKGERHLYTLSWTVSFPHARDRYYFAHCYPYTYTDLQEYLRFLSKDPSRSHYCKQKMLTRTLAGNSVYIITITSPSKCPADAKNKRAVVVTARVHPGETNSSWMMKGLLDYLTSDKPDAKLLRDTFVFKIIPMLNPDGVIVGNYRCSLSGRDLNRNYKTTSKDAFPSVWQTREMVKRLSEEREVTLYCDLHGHSRQQNVFIYGCEDRQDVSSGFSGRVFPMMLAKNCKDKFCFKRCKFKVQKSKSGTGRVVMWNLGIKNSYTLEATFCGSTLGSKCGQHFTTADYEALGYHLCDTLLDYCDPDVSKYLSILNELEIYVKALVLERMKEKGIAIPDMDPSDVDLYRDYISEIESSTSGSDSSVSDGLPMHVLYSRRVKKKKKHLKTRKERNRQRERTLVKQSNSSVTEKEVDDVENRRSTPVDNDIGSSNSRPKSNNSSLEQTNHSASRHRTPKTPQQQHEQKMTTDVTAISQVDNVKIRHYFDTMSDAYGKNGMTVSSNGLAGMPQLRYTGGKVSFGLAPATPSRSLKRWSVRPYNTTDEDEGNFIGRYMARQIRINPAARESNCESKNDKSDIFRKIQLYNESYKMVAAAQLADDKDDKDNKDDNSDSKGHKGNKGPVEKYCSHHAAMLREANDKQRNEEGRSFDLNRGSQSSSEQLSSSLEKISSRNVRQLPMSSKTVVSGVKLSEDMTGVHMNRCYKEGQLMLQSKSEDSLPSLHKDEGMHLPNEQITKSFNFSGVPRYPKFNSSRIFPHEQHSKSKHNLGDKDHPLFLGNLEIHKDVMFEPTVACSSSAHSSKRSMKKQYQDKSPIGDLSPGTKNSMVEDGIPMTTEEPSIETVNRLREKLKKLNASGRMVTVALNNQLDDVEEVLQKSLLEDYINYHEQRNVAHVKTFSKIKRKEIKDTNRQEKLCIVSPTLWNCGGKEKTEEKRKAKKKTKQI